MPKITVLDNPITTLKLNQDDYICITDIAKYKDSTLANDIIKNWLRNRNTIEFLGIWEQLNNPDFKPVEFDGFRKEAGLNSFTMNPKKWISSTNAKWREANPDKKGNIRDETNVSQLVCLANLESLNTHFIHEGLSQSPRLKKLNSIAIGQMKILNSENLKKLK